MDAIHASHLVSESDVIASSGNLQIWVLRFGFNPKLFTELQMVSGGVLIALLD